MCVCVFYSFHLVNGCFSILSVNIEMLMHLLCVEFVLAINLNLNLKFTGFLFSAMTYC